MLVCLREEVGNKRSFLSANAGIIGINCIGTQKLSLHYLIFSKSQHKHNAEQGISVELLTGIFPKQMLQKVEYYQKAALEELNIDKEIIVEKESSKEDIPDMSDNSMKKLSICYYSLVSDKKKKSCRKSRRCVLCQNLSIAYCGCCKKAYYYSVCGKKHDQMCLVGCIKFIKRLLS